MKRAIILTVAVLLVILIVAVLNPWAPLYLLLWFGCPSAGGLSGSCGDYTLGFILSRVLVVGGVALAGGIAGVFWNAAKKGRNP